MRLSLVLLFVLALAPAPGHAATASARKPGTASARKPATASARKAAAAVPDSALASYDGGFVFPAEFVRGWWNLSPDRRPPGDAIKSRAEFLSQVIDRKMLAREVAKHHIELTAAEQAEVDRLRDQMLQNALFDRLAKTLPPATDAEIELHKKRLATLAEARFVTFSDWDRARAWRQRLATGTPMSALDAAIAREGDAFAVADSFRIMAADQIPDTIATVLWSMRPGQVSEVLSFAGHPTIAVLRGFAPRPSSVRQDDESGLRIDYDRKRFEHLRQRYRQEVADRVGRTFEEDAMAFLLKAHLKLPPRSDVDSTTGLPTMRPNLPLPAIAAADTSRPLAHVRGRTFTIGDYLQFWGKVQPYARPEIRERAALEAAVDRVALAPEILRAAQEQGLANDARLQEEVASLSEGYRLDHFFTSEIEGKVRVTDAALRQFWAKDPAHYNDRASINARIILVDRKELADSLLTALAKGASFSDLARDFSLDGESGQKGGDIGLQYKGTNQNAGLEDAMFATDVGKVGGPERTPQGFVIWRVDGKTPGVVRTYAQAKDMVERDFKIIAADRELRAMLDRLRREAHVRMYVDRITPTLGNGGPWD